MTIQLSTSVRDARLDQFETTTGTDAILRLRTGMTELHAELRILRYLRRHGQLETSQLYAWLNSVRRRGGYTYQEQSQALKNLRDDGVIAVANNRWYIRTIPPGYTQKFLHSTTQSLTRP
jgi:hypothetical protein